MPDLKIIKDKLPSNFTKQNVYDLVYGTNNESQFGCIYYLISNTNPPQISEFHLRCLAKFRNEIDDDKNIINKIELYYKYLLSGDIFYTIIMLNDKYFNINKIYDNVN